LQGGARHEIIRTSKAMQAVTIASVEINMQQEMKVQA
jgi:hypothetical protein